MKQLLSFDECKQMSRRLIAMNPNRNANMGKISTCLLDYYTVTYTDIDRHIYG